MKELLIVGIGGGIGAISRYFIGNYVVRHSPDERFPFGTFFVNVTGCLIGGILAGLVEEHKMFTQDVRLFLFVGLLGGFTTFSAFSLETVLLWRRGEMGMAAGYVIASVLCGTVALYLGFKAAMSLPR